MRARCLLALRAVCRSEWGQGVGSSGGGGLGWGGAWGQARSGSAFYGGRVDLKSGSASRRRGAFVCCAGQRASVEGDSRRGRSP